MSTCRPLKKVTHILFDMDGLLLDTELLYKKAFQTMARKFGKVFTTDIQFKVMGRRENDYGRIAVEEMKLPISVDNFLSEFRSLTHTYMKNLTLMPGALNLVKHLNAHKIPMAIATSSSEESFKYKSKNYKKFFAMFHHIVTGGSDPEVKKGKPAPDIYLVCASRFPDKPCSDKCLVFEDAPLGVKAGLTAGMQVVMVPDKIVPPDLRKDAHLVIESLEDVPLELFGLPSLKSCT